MQKKLRHRVKLTKQANKILNLSSAVRGRTHVRIKGQNLNFYLETHATSHNTHAAPHNIKKLLHTAKNSAQNLGYIILACG